MSQSNDNSPALVARPELLQMAKIGDIQKWYKEFVKLSTSVLKKDLDFGVIPGVNKPSLFKPGAEKLRFVYRLQTKMECIDKTIDIENGYLDFTYKTTVLTPDGQAVLAECEGNANSYESKFRYVWVKEGDVPEGMDKTKLEKRSSSVSEFEFAIQKAETSGPYGKPKEYWQKWFKAIESGEAKKVTRKSRTGKAMEAYEMGATSYRVENPDVMGLRNTIMKMAQKRSFVGAIMLATGASEFFTQDLEDMDIKVDVDELPVAPKQETTPAPETPKSAPAKPKAAKPAVKTEEGQIVEPAASTTSGDENMRQAKLKWVKVLADKGKLPAADYDNMSLADITRVMDDYKKGIGK